MTIEKINTDNTHLQLAFSSKERPYIQSIINRTNCLLALIITKQASKSERLEYHALKWALKQLGGIEKDDLEKMKK